MATPSTTTDPKTLAATYLKALGVPVTPTNVNALALWFKYESPHAGSNIVVRGNNPLNILGEGPCGHWTSANGFHTYKIFCTPEQGATAWATIIKSGWGKKYGYDRIYLALSHGNNQTEVLKAIVDSGWVSGKPLGVAGHKPQYNFPGVNDAVSIVTQPTTGNKTVTPATTNVVPSDIPTLADALGSDPTLGDPASIKAIATQIYGTYGASGLGGNTESDIYSYLIDFAGKPASEVPFNFPGVKGYNNKFNRDKSAENDPLGALAETIGKLGANLLDPKNWVKVLAILAGGVIVLFGAWLLFKNASNDGGTAESLVSPMPIILREKV